MISEVRFQNFVFVTICGQATIMLIKKKVLLNHYLYLIHLVIVIAFMYNLYLKRQIGTYNQQKHLLKENRNAFPKMSSLN